MAVKRKKKCYFFSTTSRTKFWNTSGSVASVTHCLKVSIGICQE